MERQSWDAGGRHTCKTLILTSSCYGKCPLLPNFDTWNRELNLESRSIFFKTLVSCFMLVFWLNEAQNYKAVGSPSKSSKFWIAVSEQDCSQRWKHKAGLTTLLQDIGLGRMVWWVPFSLPMYNGLMMIVFLMDRKQKTWCWIGHIIEGNLIPVLELRDLFNIGIGAVLIFGLMIARSFLGGPCELSQPLRVPFLSPLPKHMGQRDCLVLDIGLLFMGEVRTRQDSS